MGGFLSRLLCGRVERDKSQRMHISVIGNTGAVDSRLVETLARAERRALALTERS